MGVSCRFTPKKLNTHTPYFTIVFIIVLLVVFFYMAAEYPRYEIKFVSMLYLLETKFFITKLASPVM